LSSALIQNCFGYNTRIIFNKFNLCIIDFQKEFIFSLGKNFKVILPPLSLQQIFAEIINKTEALKEKQKQSELELENLFQSLMQKAFKGEFYLPNSPER